MTERSHGAPDPAEPSNPGSVHAIPVARTDLAEEARTDAIFDELAERRVVASADPAVGLLRALISDVEERPRLAAVRPAEPPAEQPEDGPPEPGPRRRGPRTIVALGVAGIVLASTGVAAAGGGLSEPGPGTAASGRPEETSKIRIRHGDPSRGEGGDRLALGGTGAVRDRGFARPGFPASPLPVGRPDARPERPGTTTPELPTWPSDDGQGLPGQTPATPEPPSDGTDDVPQGQEPPPSVGPAGGEDIPLPRPVGKPLKPPPTTSPGAEPTPSPEPTDTTEPTPSAEPTAEESPIPFAKPEPTTSADPTLDTGPTDGADPTSEDAPTP